MVNLGPPSTHTMSHFTRDFFKINYHCNCRLLLKIDTALHSYITILIIQHSYFSHLFYMKQSTTTSTFSKNDIYLSSLLLHAFTLISIELQVIAKTVLQDAFTEMVKRLATVQVTEHWWPRGRIFITVLIF